jgi:hypothetical protein
MLGDADRARLPADADPRFMPVLGRAAVDELIGECRAGDLSSSARRCLAAARAGSDVDRCVARDQKK